MKTILFLALWLLVFPGRVQPQSAIVLHQATNQNILSPGAAAYAIGKFAGAKETAASILEPYPEELGGCRVLVNGVPALLRYVSENKISFVTPAAKLRRFGPVPISIFTPMGRYEASAVLEFVSPGILSSPRHGNSTPLGLFASPRTRPKILGDEPVPLSVPGDVTNVMLLLTGSRLPASASRYGPYRFPEPFRAFEILARVRIGEEYETTCLLYPWLGQIDTEACYFDLPEDLPQVGILPVTVIVGSVVSNDVKIEFRHP